MCAQGVNWYSAQPYTTTAKNNSETFVFGCQNDTIAGEKTETVSPLWLVGVLGLKAEVVVGAQIGIQVGFKGEWTEGYKYDRVPLGQVEIVGDHVGGHGSHWTTVGTSFYMNAGTYANIASPILILTATADVPEVLSVADAASLNGAAKMAYDLAVLAGQPPAAAPVPLQPVLATTNTSTLSLLTTQALLSGGKSTTTNPTPASLSLTPAGATLTGITEGNLVSILASALLINHATSASLGVSSGNSLTANSLGTTINGVTGGVYINGGDAGIQINALITKIGQPPVPPADYTALLTAATGAANDAAAAAVAAALVADKAAAVAAGTAAAGH